MKKILPAAMLLCIFIACRKEPQTVPRQQTIIEDTVDSKIYDTIPVPIPQDSTNWGK